MHSRPLAQQDHEPWYARADAGSEPPFEAVVCGIDRTPESFEAARQAAILAGPDGLVRYVCAGFSEDRPEEDEYALDAALRFAADMGSAAAGRLADHSSAARELLAESRPGVLLVVGTHGSSRLEGILAGSVATELLHSATGPVLVARRGEADKPFPRKLLVASDGSADSGEAVRLAAGIARRHHAHVIHLHAGDSDSAQRHAMSVECAHLTEQTGHEPTVVIQGDDPVRAVVERAQDVRSSLIVVGARGLSGLRALGSVSERVAHEASCSVLVARPGNGPACAA